MDQLVGGLEHEFYDFPYIGNNSPNWRTHIFQMGRYTTNQSIFWGSKNMCAHGQKLGWVHVSIILAIRNDYQQIEKKKAQMMKIFLSL